MVSMWIGMNTLMLFIVQSAMDLIKKLKKSKNNAWQDDDNYLYFIYEIWETKNKQRKEEGLKVVENVL